MPFFMEDCTPSQGLSQNRWPITACWLMVSNSNSLTCGNRCGIISIAVCSAPAPVTHISPVHQSPGGLIKMGLGIHRKERDRQKNNTACLSTGASAHESLPQKRDQEKLRFLARIQQAGYSAERTAVRLGALAACI